MESLRLQMPRLPTGYCCLIFRSRHAGPDVALSTFYGGHRRYGFLFVGDDDREVSFFHRG